MRKTLAAIAAVACLALPAGAATGDSTPPYDLLFKEGTLNDITQQSVLVYTREVDNPAKPEAAERDTGEIALAIGNEEAPQANLQFRQGDKHRNLGSFPASVGNPMIMYFYESVIRDMAETAGGSPFYIRNRVKDALIQPAEIETGEAQFDGHAVPVTTVTLRPFAKDPNRAQMRGFGDLALTVTMSDEVPGWYLSLVAETPGEEGVFPYRSELRFDALEVAE